MRHTTVTHLYELSVDQMILTGVVGSAGWHKVVSDDIQNHCKSPDDIDEAIELGWLDYFRSAVRYNLQTEEENPLVEIAVEINPIPSEEFFSNRLSIWLRSTGR